MGEEGLPLCWMLMPSRLEPGFHGGRGVGALPKKRSKAEGPVATHSETEPGASPFLRGFSDATAAMEPGFQAAWQKKTVESFLENRIIY